MAVRFEQDLSNLEANLSIFFPSPTPYLTPHTPPQLKSSHPGGKVMFKSPASPPGCSSQSSWRRQAFNLTMMLYLNSCVKV